MGRGGELTCQRRRRQGSHLATAFQSAATQSSLERGGMMNQAPVRWLRRRLSIHLRPRSRRHEPWGQVKKITASIPTFGDVLRVGGAISGNTAIVGAPRRGAAATRALRTSSSAIREAQGRGASAEADGGQWRRRRLFGTSVSISGDTAVVGARMMTRRGGLGSRSGSAYIFSRNAGGANRWGRAYKVTASDGARGPVRIKRLDQ